MASAADISRPSWAVMRPAAISDRPTDRRRIVPALCCESLKIHSRGGALSLAPIEA